MAWRTGACAQGRELPAGASARRAAFAISGGSAGASAGLCDKRFTFAYIFAAVEPGTDNAFAVVMPYADTAAMQAFLDRFSETIAEDEHAVMVLDQAGWHGSKDLAVPANVTLVPLPFYSPELTPVERVCFISRNVSSRIGCSPITMLSLTPPATPGTGSW